MDKPKFRFLVYISIGALFALIVSPLLGIHYSILFISWVIGVSVGMISIWIFDKMDKK